MAYHQLKASGSEAQLESVDPEISSCIAAALNGEQKYKQRLLSLSQSDAQVALDEMWKIPETSFRKELRVLFLQLARKHNTLPAKLFLQGVKCEKTEPSAGGGFADVFGGKFEGKLVALKRPRTSMAMSEAEKKKITQEFYRESLMWKHLSHKHILPFLGISDAVFNHDIICIVLPWVSNGNIRVYIERFRKLPGIEFVALVDHWLYEIFQGLKYLHDKGIVHGDMHPGNVLVDDDGSARLTDFGMARMSEGTSLTLTAEQGAGLMHYRAPELINPDQFGLAIVQPTPASDIYAFAFMCIELYTGKLPMAGMAEAQVLFQVVAGKRPARPSLLDGSITSNDMWSLIESCWAQDPPERPASNYIVEKLEKIAVSSASLRSIALRSPAITSAPVLQTIFPLPGKGGVLSPTRRVEVLDLIYSAVPSDPDRPTDASKIPESHTQDTLDEFWKLLATGSEVAVAGRALPLTLNVLERLALKLATTYDVLPATFYLQRVKRTYTDVLASGAFAEVFRGQWDGRDVALETLWAREGVTSEQADKLRKEFCREAFIWHTLDHKHLLPFLGVSYDAIESSPCMVLPLMRNGHILHHIKVLLKDRELERLHDFVATMNNWLHQIGLALTYLHAEGIVHGGLHGGNILIDIDGSVRLAGFGYGLIAEATAGNYLSKHGGSPYGYTAPELIGSNSGRPTRASDMYAFASICYELYSGQKPFSSINVYQIVSAVLHGERPERPPAPAYGDAISDSMWNLTERCWAQEPGKRPSAQAVTDDIKIILSGGKLKRVVTSLLGRVKSWLGAPRER